MTVDQIRTALDHMETNYGLAIDAGDLGLAAAFYSKIEWLWAELKAQNSSDEDTYGLEQTAWYDTSAELL
jgi:hypothetical protein